MNYWAEAYSIADVTLENSIPMWIVYIGFFVLALFVRKKGDKTRRRTGNVLIGTSIPGLLISASLLCVFSYIMLKTYSVMSSNGFRSVYDMPDYARLHELANGYPITCILFSLIIIAVMSVVAAVCGIVILARRAGKAAGIVTLVFGTALFAFDVWYFTGFMMLMAS